MRTIKDFTTEELKDELNLRESENDEDKTFCCLFIYSHQNNEFETKITLIKDISKLEFFRWKLRCLYNDRDLKMYEAVMTRKDCDLLNNFLKKFLKNQSTIFYALKDKLIEVPFLIT